MHSVYTRETGSERSLINALKERQVEAFEHLYENYAAAFYGAVIKTLYKEELSKQTLQAIFLLIWQKIDEYNPSNERLFTWANKIARKEIRRQKIEVALKELFACRQQI